MRNFPDSRSHTTSTWELAKPGEPELQRPRDTVLAWGRDVATGHPIHINELQPPRTGAKSGCVCHACNLPLTAINVGKRAEQMQMRMHFRHPDGSEHRRCMVLSARAAALRMFEETGLLQLPGRERHAAVEGFSGKVYTARRAHSPEDVRIKRAQRLDEITALLHLDDGRTLQVKLIGSGDHATYRAEYAGSQVPTILVSIDDPAVSELSPDELRSRLQILIAHGEWCSHWADSELDQLANLDATDAAISGLDLGQIDPEIDALPSLLRRESLLHLKAKELLEQAKQLMLPSQRVEVEEQLPNGKSVYRFAHLPERICHVNSVVLEKPMGAIRPDVVATVYPLLNWPHDQLLIEVTVSNPLTEERRNKIRSHGIAAIEVDLSQFSGQLNVEEFQRLLVESLEGKTWIYHPDEESKKVELRIPIEKEAAKMLKAARATEQTEERRRYLLSTLEEDWALGLVEAVMEYGALSVSEKYGMTPELMGQILETQGSIVLSVEGLVAHGYAEPFDPTHDFMFITIMYRLLSIKYGKVIGYDYPDENIWQVINTAYSERSPRAMRWHTLYTLAIRIYKPQLKLHQEEMVTGWREKISMSLREGQDLYRRPRDLDRLLGFLFPEMENQLRRPLPGGNIDPWEEDWDSS